MQITICPIDSVLPFPKNPRTHSREQVERIAKSILEFGFNQPIVIDEDGIILVGHGRLEAAKWLRLRDIPTVKLTGLTEEKKRAYRILDNKLQNDSTWDFESLESELALLEENGFDLEPWGLDDLKSLFPEEEPEAEEDDFDPSTLDDQETYIKTGDIIELGKHRVMCGDSTSKEDVVQLMQGEVADLLFTSPPYSDMRTYGNASTDLSPEYIAKFIPAWNDSVGNFAVNLGLKFQDGEMVQYWDHFIKEAKDCGLKLLGWNVWHKDTGATVAAATNMFYLRHEFIFVFGSDRKRLNRTIKNKSEYTKEQLEKGKRVLIRQADGEMTYTSSKVYNSHQLHSVLTINPVTTHGDHVATFPIELPAEHVKAFSDKDGLIAESFLGSGTTLIAADQLNRVCYGMEISPKYCQVIIERYKKHCEKSNKPFICKINGESFSGAS